MGANYFYDEVLPASEPSCPEKRESNGHQIAIFTRGAEAFIRVVPCDKKDNDDCFYTVLLDKTEIKKLINALQNVLYHFG